MKVFPLWVGLSIAVGMFAHNYRGRKPRNAITHAMPLLPNPRMGIARSLAISFWWGGL